MIAAASAQTQGDDPDRDVHGCTCAEAAHAQRLAATLPPVTSSGPVDLGR